MKFLPDNYYHIYNRGNNGNQIFLEPENYAFFLRRLRKYCDHPPAQLVAYSLMPNHYHALVFLEGASDFSNVLRAFTTSYVKAFNNWHGRFGYLYQGNTKAKLVKNDEYLIHVCRYIHLNPVTALLVDRPEQWKYSDYREWISESTPGKKGCVKVGSEYFDSGAQHQLTLSRKRHTPLNSPLTAHVLSHKRGRLVSVAASLLFTRADSPLCVKA